MRRANKLPILRRIASLAIALFAAPALAIAAQAPDVSTWLKQNTDLPLSQVVIAGPDLVYGFEAVTPRLPTGEVIGLVRTEAVSPAWAATHHFGSWDAHVLFDCDGGRMRFIRSATYSGSNRQGKPTLRTESDEWLLPKADEPGAKLVAAACDAGFKWPLRTAAAEAAPKTPVASDTPGTSAASPITHTTASIPTPVPTAPGEYAIQVAYGPDRVGAERALARAQRLLGATPDALVASTVRSYVGAARRYTAVLDGFSSAEAATQACATLVKAGQTCLIRRTPARLLANRAAPAQAVAVERAEANAPHTPQKVLRRQASAANTSRRAQLALAAVASPTPATDRAATSWCANSLSLSESAGACVSARRLRDGLEALVRARYTEQPNRVVVAEASTSPF